MLTALRRQLTPGPDSRLLAEPDAVDALAAAVLGGDGDGDLVDPGEQPQLVARSAGSLVLRRSGSIGDRRLQCPGPRSAVRVVDRWRPRRASSRWRSRGCSWRELAEIDAAQLQRGEPRVDRVRHVVAVDPVVVLVGDVHHRAVRPDPARAVVADAARVPRSPRPLRARGRAAPREARPAARAGGRRRGAWGRGWRPRP